MQLTGKYLFSTETFASREAQVISITVLILWWVILLIGVSHHEYWRDEVHLLTVALEPRSILGIFGAVKDIGHPVVWPLLLRFFHTILDSSLALPIVSVGTAFAGVFFFYFFSPFPNWQKIFFIFGVIPIYEYSVIARNYGLAMPLLFLFAHFYRTRKDNPLILASLLFLLANTSAHACLIAAVLSLMWAYEYFTGDHKKLVLHLGGFGLVVLGGVIALVTTLPGSDNGVMSVASLSLGQLIGALAESFLNPAKHYVAIFPKTSPLIRDLVFWSLFAGLCVKPIRAAGLLLGTIVLGAFFLLVGHVYIRHEGIFFLFMVTLYWITVTEENFSAPVRQWTNRWVACVGLGGIFAVHLILGGQAIWSEVNQEQSSVKRLAKYISEFSPDAILMPEPDYIFEAFPYYANNEIYLVREKKYAKRAQPTIHVKTDLNLNELIEQAQMLEQKRQKKVIIVLGHLDLGSHASKQIEFPYGKKFSWTSESLEKFLRLTEKVAEFKFSSGIENFEVYRLKE